ncbi:MAG: CDP-diacylglycerol--serine O-phosphatidyltransferase [Marinilabiliaceae bacterium]|nr:CDP-diacylglycerol--serine O-phosphatidyltransferase [Marinilabiliaceae bacterium]
MTKHIPNFLTSLNALCGTIAVFFALNGELYIASTLILIAALFDFADGFAARALKAYSEIGKELDSLADLISFGVAPAAILSNIISNIYDNSSYFKLELIQQIMVLFPFIMVVFAALRLAKFNTDTRQTENFLGLTTTATGIFTASFVFLINNDFEWLNHLITPYFIVVLVIVFSALLVSEIPMFSLKFKNYSFTKNINRYFLLIAGLILIIFVGIGGISIAILLYIIFSATTALLRKKK